MLTFLVENWHEKKVLFALLLTSVILRKSQLSVKEITFKTGIKNWTSKSCAKNKIYTYSSHHSNFGFYKNSVTHDFTTLVSLLTWVELSSWKVTVIDKTGKTSKTLSAVYFGRTLLKFSVVLGEAHLLLQLTQNLSTCKDTGQNFS